ncbi:hypothetical protein RDABS01_007670 [Bienertia sinuspersici]
MTLIKCEGFISIDCGMKAESRYDSETGIYYSSDAGFIDTGRRMDVHVEYIGSTLVVYNALRSFQEGDRNCYTLKPSHGENTSYLIRTFFKYGNYDGLRSIPQFDLFIGVNLWTTVNLDSLSDSLFYELVYTPSEDYIYVCLVNTGLGVPFISGLDLRPLNSSIYKSTTGALRKVKRYDAGPTSHSESYYSIKDDQYDRLWAMVPTSSAVWGTLHYNKSMNTAYRDAYILPPSVLKTAAIPKHDSGSLDFHLNNSEDGVYQVYWHFAEIQKLGINDSREFTISMNGQSQSGTISPSDRQVSTIVSHATELIGAPLEFNIRRTTNSALPPILNALEIYYVLNLPASRTYQNDVNAIMNIKMNYTVPKGWQGDPCLPFSAWEGLNCSQGSDDHSPRITSLNLSLNGLAGDIPHSLSALTSLTYLDLTSNKLTGQVPMALSKKVEDGSLYLSLEDNPDLCVSSPCKKKNWKKIGAILAAAVFMTLIVTAIAAFCKYKQKKQGYCEEGTIMALIYKHVANGNLQQHLSEKNVKVLCWKERLQIAIDAAQGLDYLHSGCNPSIVHRDMKTSNILLDENLHAKISDFGISKVFSAECTESAVTTNVVGTHGYLDPEYYSTQRLHKKSDVYSFGVVLLELITGLPSIITRSGEPIHIVAWIAPKLESGDIDNIVDNRLQGNYNTTSAWKALEIAMLCVSTTGIHRPSMNEVVVDLNDCLAIEIARERTRSGNHEYAYHSALNLNDDIAIIDSSIEMGPSAR